MPLQRDDVKIETIRLSQVVEHSLPVCEGSGVTTVPLYEEVLVVTRQMVLKEELHIRRRTSAQTAKPQHFKLRHEEATIKRNPAATATHPFESMTQP